MKITSKQYAQSLYQVVKEKECDVSDTVKKFIKILVSNNDISKADKIIEDFIKIWNKEEKIIEAEITSSRELDKEIVKSLNHYISELSGAKNIVLNKKINKNILGGVIIKYGDKIIDASLKMKLSELKNNLVK
ncbi:MAG: ATP synthase F1 subunit delta [Candidatus Falkowbacteria bacterium]